MNRMYEFMIKLQDQISPQILKVASTYGKVVGAMEKKKAAIGGIFTGASQKVDILRQKMLGLSSVNSRLKVDTSEIDNAAKKAKQLQDTMNRSGSSGGSSGGGMFGGIRKMMMGGALGGMLLGGVGGYLGMQGLDAVNNGLIQPAMNAQRNEFSMGVMMHSPEKAAALTGQLKNYAAENPLLGNAEVQEMGTQMVGLGYQMEKILPVMKSLGDVSAGSGNQLSDLVLIMGQIKMKGRLQAEELMQLAERKVNLTPYLAKVKGVQENQVSKMITDKKFSYEDVEKAMGMMSGKGGLFENMSARTAKETPFGKYQQILGDLENKSLEIGTALLPYVSKIMEFVGMLMGNMQPLITGFLTLTKAIQGAWSFISQLLTNLGLISEKGNAAELIMQTLGLVFTFFGNAIQFVTNILDYFTSNTLLMLLIALGSVPLLIGLITTAWTALSIAFMASPIGFIVAGVVAIGAALMTAWDKVDWFREGLLKMWETAKSVFGSIGDFMFKLFIKGDVAGAVAVISGAFMEGTKNGLAAVAADRNKRVSDTVPKGVKDGGLGFSSSGGGKGGKGSGDASGLSAAVGGTKSNTININVGSLIGKSEINVMDFQGDISQLESKVIEVLSRLINSANQMTIG